MTDAEQLLWSRLRRRQILGMQFYRQRPIGKYIVDFFAPKAKLIVEVDGGQHFEKEKHLHDRARDDFLREQDFEVLRFDNLQVLKELDAVLDMIFGVVQKRI
jgi:very-short-patch-repair endonuclease